MDAPADQQRSQRQPLAARPSRRPSRHPSRLAAWVEQARRDVRMLLDGLCGRHPAPLVSRRPRGHDVLRAPVVAGRDLDEASASPPPDAPGPVGRTAETVHVLIGGHSYEIRVQPGETILDAALAAGLPMPFSCTVGGCGACKVTCRAGVVELEEPCCLTDAERAAGHVLTCVGRPVGPVSIEVALPARDTSPLE